jgi:hypothetical protein
MKTIVGIACGVILAATTSAATGQRATHLCHFEPTVVPCTRQQDGTYLPLKWIPVWPNRALFGGSRSLVDGLRSDTISVEPFDPTKATIETIRLQQPNAQFVDYGALSKVASSLRLVYTGQVYRGDGVSAAWQRATTMGVLCTANGDGCAFARQQDRSIEYCNYPREGRIRGAVSCAVVTQELTGGMAVLASRTVSLPSPMAGGEAEYTCVVPGRPIAGVAGEVERIVRTYIGASGEYRVTRGIIREFTAEGINIQDRDERAWLRVYLRGRMSGSDDTPPNRIVDPTLRRLITATSAKTVLSITTNFTIAFASSDDITDYREPRRPMGNRIAQRFQNYWYDEMGRLASAAFCKDGSYTSLFDGPAE